MKEKYIEEEKLIDPLNRKQVDSKPFGDPLPCLVTLYHYCRVNQCF